MTRTTIYFGQTKREDRNFYDTAKELGETLKIYAEFYENQLLSVTFKDDFDPAEPIGLDAIISLAKEKAQRIHENGKEWGLSVSRGIIESTQVESGVLFGSAVALYDGEKIYAGCSAPFEVPIEAVQIARANGLRMYAAIRRLNLKTDKQTLRICHRGYISERDMVAKLTNKILNDKHHLSQALHNAMMKYLHKEEFEKSLQIG